MRSNSTRLFFCWGIDKWTRRSNKCWRPQGQARGPLTGTISTAFSLSAAQKWRQWVSLAEGGSGQGEREVSLSSWDPVWAVVLLLGFSGDKFNVTGGKMVMCRRYLHCIFFWESRNNVCSLCGDGIGRDFRSLSSKSGHAGKQQDMGY